MLAHAPAEDTPVDADDVLVVTEAEFAAMAADGYIWRDPPPDYVQISPATMHQIEADFDAAISLQNEALIALAKERVCSIWRPRDGSVMMPAHLVPEDPPAVAPGFFGPWWQDPPDLDNLPQQPPALVETTEGRIVIPADGYTVIYGGMASGKSWMAAAAAAVTAAHPGARVAYWDHEMNPVIVYKRLRLLGGYTRPGVGACGSTDRFRYVYGRQEPEQQTALVEWLAAAEGPALLVIDSINAAGGATNDAAEYIAWHTAIVSPAVAAGVAVVGIDHDIRSKSGMKDRSQHGGIGSAAKGNQADLIYQATAATWTAKLPGSTTLILRKDRHAIHGDTPRDQRCARFAVTYDSHGGLRWDFKNEDGTDNTAAAVPSKQVAIRIRADIEEQLGRAPQGLSKTRIRKLVTGNSAAIDYVLAELVAEEVLYHNGDTYLHHGYQSSAPIIPLHPNNTKDPDQP